MAIEYSRMQHDLGIVDPTNSTNVIGLVCARDEKGKILYEEFDDEYLAAQFFTGNADYANTKPQRRIPLNMSDYREGFGLDIQDYTQPKRYFSSYGADLRFKDRAMLSWGATAVTKPSASDPTILQSDMEAGVGSWTVNAGEWSQSNTQNHTPAGTYSIKNTTPATDEYVYQDVTAVPGVECTLTGWYYINTGTTTVKIGVDDGVTTTYSAIGSTAGAWTQLSIAKTLSVVATQCRIILYIANGSANDCFFDDIALTATAVTLGAVAPRCHCDFNGINYAAFGRVLAKKNSGATAFTLVAYLPYTITCLQPFQVSGTDYLFIALGTSQTCYYMATTELLTLSTTAVKTFQYFAWVNTTADTMYANDGVNTIRSTTNPLNGGVAWSAQTIVGDAANDIQDLFSHNGALYIAKEDMPYYLNSAGAVQKDLAPELVALTSSKSGKNSDIWQGNIYYPAGDQALLEIGTTNTWRSPALFTSSSSAFTGQVFTVTHDDQFLFIVTDNSTKVEILAGRLEDVDGTTSWVWHPYQEITLTGCNTAWITSIDQKSLFIASTDSTESFYRIPLPTLYGDLTSDTNRSFATDGYFETPYLHGKFPADTKAWIKVVATLGHAYDADIYWELHYKKLEDSSYTNAGDFKGTSASRIATLYLPVDASSNKASSTMMMFKLVGKTDSTTKTPILNNLYIEAVLYPTNSAGQIIACTIKDIKSMLTGKGGEPERGSQTKIQTVINNALAATYPVTIYDIEGTTHTVKFMPLSSGIPRRYPARKSMQDIDWYYNLLLQKITTS